MQNNNQLYNLSEKGLKEVSGGSVHNYVTHDPDLNPTSVNKKIIIDVNFPHDDEGDYCSPFSVGIYCRESSGIRNLITY